MANGRVLPTAILFDTLLARAWRMAQESYDEAQNLEDPPSIDIQPLAVDGSYALPEYADGFSPRDVEALVAEHDGALMRQLELVGAEWAREFQGIMAITVPIGDGFTEGMSWMQSVMGGADGLGYTGADHRAQQMQGFAAQVAAELNERGLPMPAGAGAALGSVVGDIAGLFQSRMAVQMQADRKEEARKLLLDSVETLIRLRNEALGATMDYVFAQMHMMFDVFGRNNDYLVAIQRNEKTLEAAMQTSTAALAEWDAKTMQAFERTSAQVRTTKAKNDRSLDIAALTVEQHVKRLRRYSQRAASALNSVGVSVNSSASESNTVDEDE